MSPLHTNRILPESILTLTRSGQTFQRTSGNPAWYQLAASSRDQMDPFQSREHGYQVGTLNLLRGSVVGCTNISSKEPLWSQTSALVKLWMVREETRGSDEVSDSF